MVTRFLFILLLFSLLIFIPRWKRAGQAFLLSGVLWFWLAGSSLLPMLLLDFLEVHPQQKAPAWKERNAIVLLSSGKWKWRHHDDWITHPVGLSRLHEAARLYFACKKAGKICQIISTGGDLYDDGISEGKVMARQLANLQIPMSDILLEEQSRNTYENARFSLPLLKAHNYDEVFVVTSGFHMRRSLILFEHFKVYAIPAPAENISFERGVSILPLGSNLYLADIALHEYGGMLKFFVYDSLGLAY